MLIIFNPTTKTNLSKHFGYPGNATRGILVTETEHAVQEGKDLQLKGIELLTLARIFM